MFLSWPVHYFLFVCLFVFVFSDIPDVWPLLKFLLSGFLGCFFYFILVFQPNDSSLTYSDTSLDLILTIQILVNSC